MGKQDYIHNRGDVPGPSTQTTTGWPITLLPINNEEITQDLWSAVSQVVYAKYAKAWKQLENL